MSRVVFTAVVPLVLVLPFTGRAAELTGRVVKVVDGDTIDVLGPGNVVERVRLVDVDTPERRQAFYQKAKDFTADKCFGKTVRVEWSKRDRYRKADKPGRILGTVYVGEVNVTRELVVAGLAWR